MLTFASYRRQREAAENLPLLPGYGSQNALQRNRRKFAGLLFLGMLFYALAFQIIGRFIPVYFALPLAVLILLVVWALPETGRAPTRLLTRIYFAFLVGMLFWPDYLAISLPGLPWITVLRLTTAPMMFILLISLSVSNEFWVGLRNVIQAARGITLLLVTFIGLCALSILYSDYIFHSFNHLINATLGWAGVFFVSCFVFAKPGNARRAAAIIWLSGIFWLVMSAWEWRLGHVPWQGHIPAFLAIEDETVQRVLEGSERYGGEYRLQAKFFTPISFAEYLALIGPFILHWMMTAERLITRVAAGAMLPAIFLAIVGTDSRLGAAGFMMTFMVYALFWGIRRWRYFRDSILGPAVVLAYPVMFALFMAATFFVGRLRKMVWGGGQHASSNEARQEQIEMAIPLLKTHPWGFGIGTGGSNLGYYSPNGILTVDSYVLTLLLDVGFLGAGLYLIMFVKGIYLGGRSAVESPEGDTLWILPATIALVNFVIIKTVLSQVENHGFVFALVGMVVALAWRIRASESDYFRFPKDVVRPAQVRPPLLAANNLL